MIRPISIIVAVASNYAIGKDNQLLWHISEDMKWFKRITEGHHVVMGKKTYYSLPKRPLPGRVNIVLTDIPGEQIEGCQMAYSIDDVLNLCSNTQENFIIGGGSVYRQFFSIAQKLYITHVHASFDADVFFPEIDLNTWEIIEVDDRKADEKNKYDYSFVTYKRRSKIEKA
jgi:dihydrofolate reductase